MESAPEPAEPRRHLHLLAILALVVAFVVAFWNRLALPFSTTEAAFVHAALRASGQALPPDFEGAPPTIQAKTLAVVQQVVGSHERSLRLAFLLLLAVASCVIAELVVRPNVLSAVTPLLFMLAAPEVTSAAFVLPETLVVLPASLALLAAPLGGRVGAARSVLGLVGALAAGALGFHAAVAVALPLLIMAVARGSLLDRLTAIVTAAAGIAVAWVVHGLPGSLPDLPWSPELRTMVFALAPAATLVLVAATRAVGVVLEILVVLALIGVIVFGFRTPDRPEARTAIDVLSQAGLVATPDAAFAIAGPDRVAVAAYARLGRAPAMPIIFLPENATPETLAALCKKTGIRKVWLYPSGSGTPAGLIPATPQPPGAPRLMLFALAP